MILEGKVKEVSEFVIDLGKPTGDDSDYSAGNMTKYAQLMLCPPELGMFVPCVDGKPLKRPKNHSVWCHELAGRSGIIFNEYKHQEYQKACKEVLFKGCKLESKHLITHKERLIGILTVIGNIGWLDGMKTIESLINSGIELEWNNVEL